MEGIYIKAFFNPWREATAEKALDFARKMYNRPGISWMDTPKRLAWVNEKHVKGIQFTEEDLKGN